MLLRIAKNISEDLLLPRTNFYSFLGVTSSFNARQPLFKLRPLNRYVSLNALSKETVDGDYLSSPTFLPKTNKYVHVYQSIQWKMGFIAKGYLAPGFNKQLLKVLRSLWSVGFNSWWNFVKMEIHYKIETVRFQTG